MRKVKFYVTGPGRGETIAEDQPGRLTLIGFRFGRSAAFMGEFGIGTLSVLNLGFSYKFGK